MKEDFLYYLWQHQQFSKSQLTTHCQQPLVILKTGMLNANAGPDFLDASVKIAEVAWAGSVEMHIYSSDWDRHHHQHDPKYNTVVLHVVWQHDKEVYRADGTQLPVLELSKFTEPERVAVYEQLQHSAYTIPCTPFFERVPALTKLSMLDKCLFERLASRLNSIHEIAETEQNDWERIAYRWLVGSFGFKVNQAPFDRLATLLDFQIIRKLHHNAFQIEALLFGVAGFLAGQQTDSWLSALQKEYKHLQNKFELQGLEMSVSEWNFFRLRPANFPTIRLAQLAQLLIKVSNFKDSFLDFTSAKKLTELLSVQQSAYWQKHYLPGKVSKTPHLNLGKQSVQLILINVVAPLLYAYAQYKADEQYEAKALQLLETQPAERNQIITYYQNLGLQLQSAADSQAVLQLYKAYCSPIRCLQCQIGVRILRFSA